MADAYVELNEDVSGYALADALSAVLDEIDDYRYTRSVRESQRVNGKINQARYIITRPGAPETLREHAEDTVRELFNQPPRQIADTWRLVVNRAYDHDRIGLTHMDACSDEEDPLPDILTERVNAYLESEGLIN